MRSFRKMNWFFAGIAAASLALSGQYALAQETIKIGVTLPLSGGQAVLGKQQLMGAEVAVENINKEGGINGKMLELVVRDDAANPTRGVTNIREMAGNGVHLFLGGIQSSVTLAIKPLLDELNAVFLSTAAIADSLTDGNTTKGYFRLTESGTMRYRAEAKLFAAKFPDAKKWTGLVPDAEYGYSSWKAFAAGLKEYAPTVDIMEPILYKFGATDFKLQISKMTQSAADGYYILVNGDDAVTFYQQATALGFFKRAKVVTDAGEAITYANMLGEKMASLWSATVWNPWRHQPGSLSDKLYQGIQAKGAPKFPTGFYAAPFDAVNIYATLIKKVGSINVPVIISELEKGNFETTHGGKFYFNKDHQAQFQMDFYHIENTPGVAPGWKIDRIEIVQPLE